MFGSFFCSRLLCCSGSKSVILDGVRSPLSRIRRLVRIPDFNRSDELAWDNFVVGQEPIDQGEWVLPASLGGSIITSSRGSVGAGCLLFCTGAASDGREGRVSVEYQRRVKDRTMLSTAL